MRGAQVRVDFVLSCRGFVPINLLFVMLTISLTTIISVGVAYKTKIEEYIANYEKTRRSQKHVQIDALVDILKGEGEDRFEKVFEGRSHLLPGFLVAAEDRRVNGYTEVRKPRTGKRKQDESQKPQIDDGDEQDGDEIGRDDNENVEIGDTYHDAHETLQHQHAQWQQQSQYHYWR